MADSPSMADSPKQEGIEVDTSLPFRSVRDALIMFQKRMPTERDLQQALYQSATLKEQLKSADETRSEALSGTAEARKLFEGMNQKAHCKNMSKEALGSVDGFKFGVPEEEKGVVSETEQKEVIKQPMEPLSKLEIMKQDLRNWRQELLVSQESSDFAVNTVSETSSIKEGVIDQIRSTNKSLMSVCTEANKEGSSLLVVKYIDGWMKQSQELETPDQSMNSPGNHEKALSATTAESQDLRVELVAALEDKENFAREAARAVANLKEVRSQLQMARLSEGHAVFHVAALSSELGEAKGNLMNALETAMSLKSVVGSYQDELRLVRKDIAELRERKAFESAVVTSLTVEINQVKSEIADLATAEAKANDSISYLVKVLEQAKSEVEEAKLEVALVKKEVQNARSDERAKAAMDAAEGKWQADGVENSYKTTALTQNKALLEEPTASSASVNVLDAIIGLSQEDDDALKRKTEEIESIASAPVSAALFEVGAVGSEQEIRRKSTASNDEHEETKKAAQQAFYKVEMAEAAKSEVECELRRLREREERRRERGAIAMIQQASEQPCITSRDDRSFSFGATHIAPLGTVLNMNIPCSGEHKKLEITVTQKKKKNVLPSFRGYLLRQ